jgi:hypothetical protein
VTVPGLADGRGVDVFDLTTCIALDERGRDCRADPMEDAPIPLCRRHMRIAYLHYADTLRFHTDPTPEEIADIERDPGVHALGLNLRGRDPVVYYIKIGNHIKIGYTTDLATRMAALQPDHIFGTERGDRDLERQRHEQFAHLRSKGREYFDPADDLMAHIIEVCSRPKELVHADRIHELPGYVAGVGCPACGLLSLKRLWMSGDAVCMTCSHRVSPIALKAAAQPPARRAS